MAACDAMWTWVHADERFLEPPTSLVEGDILRVCVENGTWPMPYAQRADTPHVRALPIEARCALQTLAAKPDAIGVAVNHIPND